MQLRHFITLMSLFVLIAVLCGCASKNTGAKKEHNALLVGNNWEVNRSVMLAAENSGNIDVALKTGTDELKMRPDNDEARIHMARLQSRQGRPDQAMMLLDGVSPKAAQTPQYKVEVARAHIAGNAPDLAKSELSSITGANAMEEREIRKLQGVCEDLSGNHEAAQAVYRALLSEKEEGSVRYNYGRSLVATRSYASAASTLLPLVDDPKFPQARVLAAGALMSSGDNSGARNLLEGYLSSNEIDDLLSRRKVN